MAWQKVDEKEAIETYQHDKTVAWVEVNRSEIPHEAKIETVRLPEPKPRLDYRKIGDKFYKRNVVGAKTQYNLVDGKPVSEELDVYGTSSTTEKRVKEGYRLNLETGVFEKWIEEA